MPNRIKSFHRTRRTLAVGSSVLMAGSLVEAQAGSLSFSVSPKIAGTHDRLSARGMISADSAAEPEGDEIGSEVGSVVVKMTLPSGAETHWNAVAAKRFKDLSVMRALGTASPSDNVEFDGLQRALRPADDDRSSAEILAECRRRRFYHEMLEVLKRNVQFLQAADQEKLRSIGHHGA